MARLVAAGNPFSMPYDWNDLRFFLVVARKGSTTAAASVLGASASTVARRIAALEEDLGAKIFDRRPDGYRLTELGEQLIAPAEVVERAAGEIERSVSTFHRGAAGTLRVTAMDLVASELILPHLFDFRAAYPLVEVELLTTDEKLDLVTGEAEIALRFGPSPVESGLVCRRVGRVEVALYCSRAYEAKAGIPATVEELNDHAVIRGIGYVDTRPHHLWMAEAAPRAKIAHRANNSLGIHDAVRRGLGIGSLATAQADRDPDLVRVPVGPTIAADAWLITTEANRFRPHVRAFLDFIAPRIIERLHGATPSSTT